MPFGADILSKLPGGGGRGGGKERGGTGGGGNIGEKTRIRPYFIHLVKKNLDISAKNRNRLLE